LPAATPQSIRKSAASGALDPVYLIVGDDETEMAELTTAIASVVEEDLRAFNLERLYANEKSVTPVTIVQAARTLPMLGDRRVVVVLRAERLLKPKRRGGKAADADDTASGGPDEEPPSDLDALDDYVKKPEPGNTLVLVASDVDRQRKVYKALQKHATVVECWGLKASKDAKVDLRQVARDAEAIVKARVADAGQQIEPAAARLIAERAGTDISRLRADLDKLLLYAAGKPKISLADVQEVVSVETSQDDWAVTNAIGRGDAREALRQMALLLEAGGVPYQILGQLAWYVRDRMSTADPRRLPAAVDALLRTDLELKSSAGDPRVLLERLVVDLSRR
jgi:DNA polymerase-3 subunit delta